MIFVTLGTHEQPFNRVLIEIDLLKKNKVINENVVVQSGFSTYRMKYCEQYDVITYEQMKKNIKDARIVISHGGPASFLMVLQEKKVPIVVPRQKRFNEHVNDHQVEFVRQIFEKKKNIIPVYEITDLKKVILNYDTVIHDVQSNLISNNQIFNEKFNTLTKALVNDK
ncbi:MAG: glycosyltransferase [Liquorilactobacillus hordei]|uniref:glycosyltransferase n=1 Tax=Liquorilactobacillus hordei TaxID=468911 RepID=UPI0039EBADF4